MIFNLAYWIRHNEANGLHYHDGRTWTFNSVEAFTKLFPFWSRGSETNREVKHSFRCCNQEG